MAPLQVLLLAGLLQAFLHFNHAVFRAVGQPRRSWQLGLASLTLNVCLVTVAVRWGVLAVAWAYLLRVALIGPWGTVLVCRELGLGARRVGQTVASPLTAAMSAIALAAGVWWLLGEAWSPLAPGSEVSRAWLAWAPALLVYGAWLWLRSPALDALRHRHAASGSRNHKWGPVASRVSRPA